MALNNRGPVYPISKPNGVISQQPRPVFKPMKGFSNQDPDMVKNAIADLKPLTDMTTVLIRPKIIPLEDITGWETVNEYDICTITGEVLYKVVEETDCCARCVCGPLQPFNIYIKTPEGRPVIQLVRRLTIGSYLCGQFVQHVQVYFPPGKLIGTIERKRHLLMPKFEIRNTYKEIEYHIEGPYCTCSCCGDVDYDIMNVDKSATLGRVSKNWRGIFKEAFTKTEFFGVEFPLTSDLNTKVNLLGASFLIAHIYFDH